MSDYTPMEREVVEHRLEFDVWGQDCKGWNRYLEALTQLRDTLLRAERMQAVVDAAVAWQDPGDPRADSKLDAAVDAYLAGEQ